VLVGISVGAASAAEMPSLDLPPGIEAQSQPLLDDMMERMSNMPGMTDKMMMQHMLHMQTMADELPPGIFLNLLKLMPELDMPDMMALHEAMTQGDLMQQPPGQILKFVKNLAK
jgi:hypothetical protein